MSSSLPPCHPFTVSSAHPWEYLCAAESLRPPQAMSASGSLERSEPLLQPEAECPRRRDARQSPRCDACSGPSRRGPSVCAGRPIRIETGRDSTDCPSLPEDREPGRPRRTWCRPAPNGENAPHHILCDGNAEGQGDLLSDPGTTPRRIPPFHVDDGGDDVLARSLGTRLRLPRRRKEPTILPLCQRSMKAQQC